MKQPQPRTVGLVGGLLGLAAAGTAVGVAATRAASSRVRAERVGPVPGALPLPQGEATDRPAAVQRADDPLGAGSRSADRTELVHATDGVLLHVEEVGPEDAPLTVVFVHGYSLSMASWTFQRRDLGRSLATGNGHAPQARLVFYDQRGHGASARGDADRSTIDQLADDLVSVLDARVPRGPVVLVGHSMGGMTLLQLAARRPELFGTRVVGAALVSTSAGGLDDLDLGLPGVVTRLRAAVFPVAGYVMRHRPGWAEFVRRAAADVVSWATKALSFAGDDVDPRLVDYVDAMIGGTPVEVIAEFYPALVGLDASAALEPLAAIPVLVLTGDADKLIPQGHSDRIVAALTAAGARDVRYRVVPDSGHLVLLEHPDEVTAAITDLVRRVAAR
ncbi:Pimeloyl-ACP methyl ester carboxylesterase [Klenkia soli]|uniref:Pimeloyl-ACP methyl ester carboxylesterase n=1 Tax=Klenkia soli TaxID=1052260 RepID=A0A1H0CXA2_9ACTN|nr:alpha/beta hydrolase [Klenkia soli]SDN62540.1 Pimeloyl-ACP methyl ester carboxylesterase [Klenkia soli]